MKIGVVIPVGPGRAENLTLVLGCLRDQMRWPDAIVVVEDGPALEGVITGINQDEIPFLQIKAPKHEPGMEQPRNIGVRMMRERWPDIEYVWFLDSDVIVMDHCLVELEEAILDGDEPRIVVAPYDWLPAGVREPMLQLHNDPRMPSFDQYGSQDTLRNDLAAGLACFSGNLAWPLSEFVRVGGFWSEIHHGRCEDGELGLRAVAMGVPITFAPAARGWHLDHERNTSLAMEWNARDVPMLNERHPWVERGAVFMVDRDGKAFDVRCKCGAVVPTIGWWQHASTCLDTTLRIEV